MELMGREPESPVRLKRGRGAQMHRSSCHRSCGSFRVNGTGDREFTPSCRLKASQGHVGFMAQDFGVHRAGRSLWLKNQEASAWGLWNTRLP